jgi:WD40 repeat protein
MLYRPTEIHQTDTIHLESSQSNQYRYQHGHSSILLAFPSESLTHITCFLNPSSLLALGRTNKYLNNHVNDDNTWHRAFVCQFLGIGPEGNLRNTKTLMLRRCENSWSKEFIVRYNIRRCGIYFLFFIIIFDPICRRWERSHNSTITHTPHHSTVSGMQLMPDTGLLTSSIEYGIVSRSLPLTGKILRGYLDASGTGLGNGNPNAEFTPNVSACALSSDGGTAKIIWGFRNGEVALMSANKAMDLGRATAKLTRCKIDDEHAQAVQDTIWCTNNVFVTGALDGKVKLWDAKRVKCIWTSDIKEGSLIADPCVKVAATITEGVVVGVMKSGVIVVWTGLGTLLSEDSALPVQPIVPEIRISSPNGIPEPSSPERNTAHDIMAIYLDHSTPCELVILAAYLNNTHFYRLRVDLQLRSAVTTLFGEESSGSITAIKALFSDQEGESSFVIAGDQFGCIGIYDWGASPPSESSNDRPPFVRPLRKFEAHEDGAVTAIAWNSITLVSGSSRGTIKIWDSLTFTLLRSFSSPGVRPPTGGEWDGVGQIILQRELLIVSVGSRVMTWRAGHVGQRGKSTWNSKQVKRLKKNGASKGFRE